MKGERDERGRGGSISPRDLGEVLNALAMDPGDIGASFWNGALRRVWFVVNGMGDPGDDTTGNPALDHLLNVAMAHKCDVNADLLAACEAIDTACAEALTALRESTERSPGMVRAQVAGIFRDRIQAAARAALAKAKGGAR